MNPSDSHLRPRTIRLFLSSTFRDMHAEREVLVKRVFPQLRKACEARGVVWTEVDLRWGVTEEQVRRDELLPTLLAEIERCDYFVGLLGERYGWVPDRFPPELVERHPWLRDHLGRSVTELEIVYAAFHDGGRARRTWFHFRDPAYVETRPAEVASDFRAEDGAARSAQHALKARVRALAGVRDEYPDPEALGERILRELGEAIDADFPSGSEPDWLDREAAEHGAFARSRVGVYVGRGTDFARLDAHADGDGPPLVVLGESGSGKSALLANWAERRSRDHPGQVVLSHFVGSSNSSSDWSAMLRRLLGEFRRHFRLTGEIPAGAAELRSAFADGLRRAGRGRRFVLIIDALNQLEDRDGAGDLVWLPAELPAGVRLVVSTLPGRARDVIAARGWPTHVVEPLATDERERLVTAYLGQYGKGLHPERVRRIASSPRTSNPLYLRTLLEELRVFGSHERLGEKIDHYLASATIPELFDRILSRLEEDYDPPGRPLVGDVLASLLAARRGLSEDEILGILAMGGPPVPRIDWVPLRLALEPSLVERSGLINFSHEHMREAVHSRYCGDEGRQRVWHQLLANYFDWHVEGRRRTEELPWQLAEGGLWERLSFRLAEPDFFDAVWEANPTDMGRYWAGIEANSDSRLIDTYRAELEAEGLKDFWHFDRLGELFSEVGQLGIAEQIYRAPLDEFRRAGRDDAVRVALTRLARIAMVRGRYDEAAELLAGAERLTADDVARAKVMRQRAVTLTQTGRSAEARALDEEADRLDPHGSAGSDGEDMMNRAILLKNQGRLDEALELEGRAEAAFRSDNNVNGLIGLLANRSITFRHLRRFDEAIRLLEDQESLIRQGDSPWLLAGCLGNQANVLHDMGDPDRAAVKWLEQERICRAFGFQEGLKNSLLAQAIHFKGRGDDSASLEKYDECAELCRSHGFVKNLMQCLAGRAQVFARLGRPGDATVSLDELERIALEGEDWNWLAIGRDIRVTISGATAGAADCREAPGMTAAVAPGPEGVAPSALFGPSPHPGADPDEAARLNIQYQRELQKWQALPFWKRWLRKPP